jgi:hypothetical protein
MKWVVKLTESFLYVMICHFIGDFYLQTTALSFRKKSELEILLIHSFLYMIPFMTLLIAGKLATSFDRLFFLAAIGSTHFLVDAAKSYFTRHFGGKGLEVSYLVDQALHLLILYGISVSFLSYEPIQLSQNTGEILKWILYLLLILKPANVTFRIVFSKYQSKDDDNDSIPGAGTMIGSLERLLMALMIAMQQFAAIGFVLTAKSIARYDKISRKPAFAEYFLIGTLYSTIATVSLYILLFRII